MKAGDLVKEDYRVVDGELIAEANGIPMMLDAEDCCERLDAYKSFILKSPALGTLSREVEVPDRHTIRMVIEEMEAAVVEGATAAQLGFWVGELSRIREV